MEYQVGDLIKVNAPMTPHHGIYGIVTLTRMMHGYTEYSLVIQGFPGLKYLCTLGNIRKIES
jgi:hypothetical protein